MMPGNAKAGGKLAYLTSLYPATSHTFIRREVTALRGEGFDIHTFSVRRPSAEELESETDRSEAERTFYILDQSAAAFLLAHALTLLRRPIAYFRTFALALRHRAPGARGLVLALAHFAESILLAKELARREIAHLHNHFANSAATVGLLASRLLGIRWSFTMHGISETDYPAGLLLPDKIRSAEMVVCVSWFGRAQGMRLVPPSAWHKFHVVRCGVPLDRLPARSPARDATTTILCVGRLSPEKAQGGLLQAFARLLPDNPGVRLRLVGDGPDRVALESLACSLGVRHFVSFAGRLPEDQTLHEIARADLLALPSFMEGLPIVLMEAMALQVPVIASRVAGIPELVEHGTNGLLFTPGDWDELAACMDRLLKDAQMRERLATAAHSKIRSEYESGISAAKLAALFRPTLQAALPTRAGD